MSEAGTVPQPVARRHVRAFLLTIGVLIAGWVLLRLLGSVQRVFLLTFVGVVLSVVLRLPVDFLSRWMPRAVATFVSLLSISAALAGVVILTIPTVSEQAAVLVEKAPAAIDRVQAWWAGVSSPGGALDAIGGPDMAEPLTDRLRSEGAGLLSKLLPAAFGTISVVGAIVFVVVLAAFLAHRPDVYFDGLLRLTPPRYEADVRDVLLAMGAALRGWTRGTLVAMGLTGLLTGLGLLLIGIDSWLVLGIIAFFGDFIPFVGPFLAMIPGVAVALADSPEKALWAVVVYVIVQQIEGNLIQPVVMKRAVKVAPATLLVGQLLLTGAFGFLGLVVATPLLACVQVALRVAYVEKALGK
jgi:predicted PurR-regulated permease PerM